MIYSVRMSLYSKQIEHFIDKSPEELAEALSKAPTDLLHGFLKGLKESRIKYPNSPALDNLEQAFIDELMNRDTDLRNIHIEEIEELPEQIATLNAKQLYGREFPSNKWIIDRIVPDAGFVMFVGEAGAGKSFIALDAIRAVITQTPFLDHFETNTKCKILIIDKENGLRRLKTRMQG